MCEAEVSKVVGLFTVLPYGLWANDYNDYHTTVLKMLDAGSKLSGLGNETLP